MLYVAFGRSFTAANRIMGLRVTTIGPTAVLTGNPVLLAYPMIAVVLRADR
jgi:hypothetical protein